MEVLLVAGITDSAAADKERKIWPALQGNTLFANLENLQQLEIVTVKTARGFYRY